MYPNFETNPGTPRPRGYLTGPRVCTCESTKKMFAKFDNPRILVKHSHQLLLLVSGIWAETSNPQINRGTQIERQANIKTTHVGMNTHGMDLCSRLGSRAKKASLINPSGLSINNPCW